MQGDGIFISLVCVQGGGIFFSLMCVQGFVRLRVSLHLCHQIISLVEGVENLDGTFELQRRVDARAGPITI